MDISTTHIEGSTGLTTEEITKVYLDPIFEELVTAHAVITEVKGPDHPLVDPDTPGSIARLVRGDDPETGDQLVIDGSNARDLLDSFKVVAYADEGNYRNSARYMLAEAGIEAPEIESNIEEVVVSVPEIKYPTLRRVTSRPNAILTPDYVELHTYQDRLTAFSAVSDFALPALRGQVLKALNNDIDRLDPCGDETSSYEAPVAGEIVECLTMASLRLKTVFDDVARVMIESMEEESSAPTAAWALAA